MSGVPYTQEALWACIQRLHRHYRPAPIAMMTDKETLWEYLVTITGGPLRADFQLAKDKGLALEDIKWQRL